MLDNPRSVLVWDKNDSFSQWTPSVQKCMPEWTFRNFREAMEVPFDREPHPSMVGLIVINTPCCFADQPREITEIESMISRSPQMTRWIGLIDKSCLQDDRLMTLIGHNFFDYHRLPPDLDRLA